MVRNQTADSYTTPEGDVVRADPMSREDPNSGSQCFECKHALRFRMRNAGVTYCKLMLQPTHAVTDCSDFDQKG